MFLLQPEANISSWERYMIIVYDKVPQILMDCLTEKIIFGQSGSFYEKSSRNWEILTEKHLGPTVC